MKPCEIMVVDDTRANLELLIDILTRFQFEVRAFAAADTAFQSSQKRPPDLFILDLYMPGKDGMALARDLFQSDTTRTVPVLIMSGTTRDSLPSAEGTSVQEFIEKPFQIARLIDVIKKLTGRP